MFSPSKVVANAKKYLYTDLVTFECITEVVNEETGQFESKKLSFGEYPCRISFKNLDNAVNANGASNVNQRITLFLSNEIKVPINSSILVKRYGKSTMRYKASGIPNIYSNHQEITLEREQVRADE